jgi:hypothetical protein
MLSIFRRGRPQGETAHSAPAPEIRWTYGLQAPLHTEEDAQVESVFLAYLFCKRITKSKSIIFVHGLNGDRIDTFTTVKPDGTKYSWIVEDLPQTLRQQGLKCRIFSYGYNAATHTGRLSLQDLWDHGEQLLTAVADKRAVEGV